MTSKHPVAAGLVLALVGLVGAQDTTQPKVPFNPFEKVAVGDWCVLVSKPPREGEPHNVIFYRVEKIADGKVSLLFEDNIGDINHHVLNGDLSQSEAPVFLQVLNPQNTEPTPPATDEKVSDEKVKVGGHEFACKKLTFAFAYTNFMGAATKGTVEAFFAPEAKPIGVVKYTLKEKAENQDPYEVSPEIRGFGNKDKVTWGKSLDDVLKEHSLKR